MARDSYSILKKIYLKYCSKHFFRFFAVSHYVFSFLKFALAIFALAFPIFSYFLLAYIIKNPYVIDLSNHIFELFGIAVSVYIGIFICASISMLLSQDPLFDNNRFIHFLKFRIIYFIDMQFVLILSAISFVLGIGGLCYMPVQTIIASAELIWLTILFLIYFIIFVSSNDKSRYFLILNSNRMFFKRKKYKRYCYKDVLKHDNKSMLNELVKKAEAGKDLDKMFNKLKNDIYYNRDVYSTFKLINYFIETISSKTNINSVVDLLYIDLCMENINLNVLPYLKKPCYKKYYNLFRNNIGSILSKAIKSECIHDLFIFLNIKPNKKEINICRPLFEANANFVIYYFNAFNFLKNSVYKFFGNQKIPKNIKNYKEVENLCALYKSKY